jgi:pimeloyl-ACP methyl ester carboxylesterase
VILDGGHGAFSPVFGHIQHALSDTVQVVSYDRPGYGWSDPADRDPLGVAEDLREALALASVDGPFIVVGHSLGGLYARRFAHSYPEEITGLVLIDPAHEHQLERLPEEVVAQMGMPTWLGGPMTAAAHLGILRLLNPGADTTVGLPARSAAELEALSLTPRYLRTYLAEAHSFDRIAASMRPLAPHHPTVMLNAPVAQPGLELARPVMYELSRELTATSPNATLIEVPGADHTTVIADRGHAEQVAAVVLELHRAAAR